MLKITDFSNQYSINCRQNTKETKNNIQTNNNDYNLADNQANRAILAQYGINFKASLNPTELTSIYNKSTANKEHLDLPNIHVYEYPDTNLQAIINEFPYSQNKNNLQASLTLVNKKMNNSSPVKQKLFMDIMSKNLKDNNINASINNSYGHFLNIDFESSVSDINKLQTINKLIINPNITQKELDESKTKLIQYIKSEKYEQENTVINNLIDKSLIKSKEDTIKEIKNITIRDIYDYHSDILKNTEMQYFITVDKDFAKNNKNKLLSILNSNISNKFQKHSTNSDLELKSISPTNDIEIFDDKNETYLSSYYPVNINSAKDKLIYKYITSLEILCNTPYISKNSKGKTYQPPFELKNNSNNLDNLGVLKFDFTPTGDENITSTDDAIVVFKAILESLYDDDFTEEALETMKKCDKDLYTESLNGDSDSNSAHEILQSYGYDIFNIYELIDDITITDITSAIEKTFFEQNPVIIVNENLNPYNS